VTTDAEGAFVLEFTPPPEDEFEDMWASVNIIFESPVGDAENLTNDGKSYEVSYDYIHLSGDYDQDTFMEENPDIRIEVDKLEPGKDATVKVSYPGADGSYGLVVVWFALEGDEVLDDIFLFTGFDFDYQHLAGDLYGFGASMQMIESMEGGSASLTISVPPFLGKDNRITFVAIVGLLDDEPGGYNQVTIDIGEGGVSPSDGGDGSDGEDGDDEPDGTVVGPFLSSDGEPISGATVTVTDEEGKEHQALTDEDGYATLEDDLPEGDYTCEVEKSGETMVEPFDMEVTSSGGATYDGGSAPPKSALDASDVPEGTDPDPTVSEKKSDKDDDSIPGPGAALGVLAAMLAIGLLILRGTARRRT
jgi:hypothetical protein